MPSRIVMGALAALAAIATAAAQQPAQPYAGLQARQIRALSAEQIADFTAGRGMGLALAAELSGYPGPLHVLELADRLALTDIQRAAIQRQYDSMKAEAIELGRRLIAAEQELDRAFADRTITPERLHAATQTAAALSGELRSTHLRYHLATAAVLNAEQIRRYAELRGYVGARAAPSGHSVHHGADHRPHQQPVGPGR
jgi:hypothetical protein